MNTPPTSTRPDPEGEPADKLAPSGPASFAPMKPLQPEGMTFKPSRTTPNSWNGC